ncbi:unnamed protein product [Amoebophrya sp. A25]|nr:unnamed protein product [Amoebophrya sp. A25]|eukprot:GSA25T00021477001.1
MPSQSPIKDLGSALPTGSPFKGSPAKSFGMSPAAKLSPAKPQAAPAAPPAAMKPVMKQAMKSDKHNSDINIKGPQLLKPLSPKSAPAFIKWKFNQAKEWEDRYQESLRDDAEARRKKLLETPPAAQAPSSSSSSESFEFGLAKKWTPGGMPKLQQRNKKTGEVVWESPRLSFGTVDKASKAKGLAHMENPVEAHHSEKQASLKARFATLKEQQAHKENQARLRNWTKFCEKQWREEHKSAAETLKIWNRNRESALRRCWANSKGVQTKKTRDTVNDNKKKTTTAKKSKGKQTKMDANAQGSSDIISSGTGTDNKVKKESSKASNSGSSSSGTKKEVKKGNDKARSSKSSSTSTGFKVKKESLN